MTDLPISRQGSKAEPICRACLNPDSPDWVYLASQAKGDMTLCRSCHQRLQQEISNKMISSFLEKAEGY
jgi:hypothetical protein